MADVGEGPGGPRARAADVVEVFIDAENVTAGAERVEAVDVAPERFIERIVLEPVAFKQRRDARQLVAVVLEKVQRLDLCVHRRQGHRLQTHPGAELRHPRRGAAAAQQKQVENVRRDCMGVIDHRHRMGALGNFVGRLQPHAMHARGTALELLHRFDRLRADMDIGTWLIQKAVVAEVDGEAVLKLGLGGHLQIQPGFEKRLVDEDVLDIQHLAMHGRGMRAKDAFIRLNGRHDMLALKQTYGLAQLGHRNLQLIHETSIRRAGGRRQSNQAQHFICAVPRTLRENRPAITRCKIPSSR